MENKKSLKANLEKTKSIFLMIGLITAISLLVFAFSWESVQEYVEYTGPGPVIQEDFTKVTRNDEEKKEEKVEKPTPKKVYAEIIKLVDDTTTVKDFVLWTPEDTITFVEPIEETDNEPLPWTPVMPIFPGGKKALQVYVANHVIYPAVAKENGIQGTVHLRFEVTKKGTIGKIEILNKTIDKLLQDASIDVIKTLPKFKPGMQNGKKVSVWFSIPISFKLN